MTPEPNEGDRWYCAEGDFVWRNGEWTPWVRGAGPRYGPLPVIDWGSFDRTRCAKRDAPSS